MALITGVYTLLWIVACSRWLYLHVLVRTKDCFMIILDLGIFLRKPGWPPSLPINGCSIGQIVGHTVSFASNKERSAVSECISSDTHGNL
jgi:hypothetical protein